MLARLQQIITLTLLASALAWLYACWDAHPVLALAGFAFIALGYSLFLALEFIALRIVNRADPAPAPQWRELIGAWWGETQVAPRIFCWRQPFRSGAVPDHVDQPSVLAGRRGVVFIHGFFCNRGFWNPWLKRLQLSGHAFSAVSLEPVFGSIDDYAPLIEAAVQRVTRATGMPPILVCHSMGGLAARAWLRAASGAGRVHHIITIGTPHGGTWLGRFSHVTNGSEMRLSSEWLQKLAAHEEGLQKTDLEGRVRPGEAPAARFTCWYSNCDNIVFPTSTATLAGADNRLVRGLAHVQMAFDAKVMDGSLAIISTL